MTGVRAAGLKPLEAAVWRNGHGSRVAVAETFRSPLLVVYQWRCLAARAEPDDERFHLWPVATVVHEGACVVHRGRSALVAEPGTTILHDAYVPYRSSHPFGCGDEGCTVAIRPDTLRELRGHEGSWEGAWPALVGHAPSGLLLRLYVMLRRWGRAPADRLAVEECALDLAAALVRGRPLADGKRPTAAHQELAEALRRLLYARLTDAVSLDGLAAALGVTAPHLVRVFRRVTGLPVHRYRTRLRLHATLGRILEGGSLTEVALDHGFSSHSHFTAAFRREFGVPPVAVRRLYTAPAVPSPA
jgi:AraC-like DNA-binding protein